MFMFAVSNIEENLAYCCAPCFAGVKPANLVSVPAETYTQISLLDEEFLNAKGFYLKVLCECEKRVQIFLYNKYALEQIFLQSDIKNALKFFGYPEYFSLKQLLEILALKMNRLQRLEPCKKRKSFPHEIGLFLGYPVYDVMEYYKNGGEGCIFSGYWKVYADAERAAKIFNQYNECKKHFALQIEKGLSLYDLLSA
ncbi:MAG: DUF3793 family protein [Treponema pedis]